jgi:hypothetical protein
MTDKMGTTRNIISHNKGFYIIQEQEDFEFLNPIIQFKRMCFSSYYNKLSMIAGFHANASSVWEILSFQTPQ